MENSSKREKALNHLRFVTVPDTVKVRIKDNAWESLVKGDFDALMTSLQCTNTSQLVDPLRGIRVTSDNLHEQPNIRERMAALYLGTDAVTGAPCRNVDHETAATALVNHYSSYTVGDVMRISANGDSITFTRSGAMELDIQDSFNIAEIISNDLMLNIAALANSIDESHVVTHHTTTVNTSYALMHRQLTQALTVLESAQKVFDQSVAALTKL